MEDKITTARSCINMLEKYYDEVKSTNSIVALREEDARSWLREYYPKLVQEPPKLADDRFFYPDGSHPNYGIGNDAAMSKYNYCNFMYRCYDYAFDTTRLGTLEFAQNPDKVMTLDCMEMLKPYLAEIEKNPFGGTLPLKGEDMKLWKTVFFPKLVRGKVIPDGSFFGASDDSNIGIGNDGIFSPAELVHFLYECIKFLDR